MDRREFLLSAGATTLFSGCWGTLFEQPELRFGVVSDIHVTTSRGADSRPRIVTDDCRNFKVE